MHIFYIKSALCKALTYTYIDIILTRKKRGQSVLCKHCAAILLVYRYLVCLLRRNVTLCQHFPRFPFLRDVSIEP